MKKIILKFIFLFIFSSSICSAEVVKDFKVIGNDRISKETVAVFGDIVTNQDYDPQKINDLLKKLYDTNYFSNIEINVIDGILEIRVSENPIIQSLIIKGIKAKKFQEKINEIIELKEKTSFVENKLQIDIKRVEAVLHSTGYYFVNVDAYKKENANNSIDLIYEIELGDKALIEEINFIGDKKYKERKLRNVITSEENKFWKFISTKKYLNKERIDLDTRLLENFYKSKGYYEVKIFPTEVYFENKKKFNLTYNIDSGTRYIISKALIEADEGIDDKYFSELQEKFSKYENKYYSPLKIKKILDKIEKLTQKKELQFIKSELIETLDKDKINVKIFVTETEKLYVERVNIFGNYITNDNVVRSELIVDEGDPYSVLLINKSINNMMSRNIFKSVEHKVVQGSSPDLRIINIEVEEKPTGEISAGAGVGSSGGTIGFSVSENNYLGNGIRLDASLYLTEESIRGLFSVDNPNWNYSGNSLRTTIESTKVDKLADSGYESSKTGFSFGTQFEQWENIYISPSISTYYESISTDSTASDALKKQDGTSFDTYLRYAIIDDKRNQRFQPSEGSRKSFNQKIPLYSGNPSILNGFNYAGYYSPTDNIIGSLKFYGRAINSLSDDDVRVSERLFIPSRLLRGFERGRIGPRDGNDHVGGNYATALGFNAHFPNLLPRFTNTDISFFLDTANVWGIDYSDTVDESNKLRSAFGVSADWFTPIGPLNFSLSQDITKASTDVTESFRFNIGTTF